MEDRDLPEGVINADPPGGWEDSAVADEESAERNAVSAGSADLIESDEPGQVADPDISPEEDR